MNFNFSEESQTLEEIQKNNESQSELDFENELARLKRCIAKFQKDNCFSDLLMKSLLFAKKKPQNQEKIKENNQENLNNEEIKKIIQAF